MNGRRCGAKSRRSARATVEAKLGTVYVTRAGHAERASARRTGPPQRGHHGVARTRLNTRVFVYKRQANAYLNRVYKRGAQRADGGSSITPPRRGGASGGLRMRRAIGIGGARMRISIDKYTRKLVSINKRRKCTGLPHQCTSRRAPSAGSPRRRVHWGLPPRPLAGDMVGQRRVYNCIGAGRCLGAPAGTAEP
jgi:hypothetical protein